MPKYYFDIDENGVLSRDELGLEFPDLECAIVEATATLPAVARESLQCHGTLMLSSWVRNEGGKVVFEATLQMKTRQLA